MPNTTHRQLIARAYAREYGQPYTRALAAVDAAAAAAVLPTIRTSADVAAAVAVVKDRDQHATGTAPPNPRNIASRHIPRVAPADLAPGHVTMYGVIIGTRPAAGGFFVDYPHNTTVFVDAPEPVICTVDEHFLSAVIEAVDQEALDVARP